MNRAWTLMTLLMIPILGYSQMCSIDDISTDFGMCDGTDSLELTIDFGYSNTSDSFLVNTNSSNFGPFAYADLPITLGKLAGDCTTNYRLTVRDQNDSDCNNQIQVGQLCCDCSLSNLVVTPIECVGDSCLRVEIDFGYMNVGNSGFNLYRNRTELLGTFQYQDLPLTFDCWPVDGFLVEKAGVCDVDDPNCCIEQEFGTLGCDSCEISNLVAIPQTCDTLKRFSILTQFDHMMPGDSGYCIMVNDSLFGPFSYDTTQRTIGPLQGGCDSMFTVVAFDKEFANCSDTVRFEDVCCDPCTMGTVFAEAIECNGDSCLKIRLDFDYIGTGNNGFNVYSRNGLFGTFDYNDLPLTIDCFPITDPDSEYVRVCDVDSVMCCSETEFETIDCSPPCEITNLTVDDTDCNADGEFFVTINFDYDNASDSFYIFGNGRSLGPFSYSVLPFTTGPFQGDCVTNYEFVITDADDPLCTDAVTVGRKCCDQCEITDLEVEVLGCNGDSCLIVEIDFEHMDTGGNAFDVFTSQGYFATYNYLQLPLTIDCFPKSGNAFEFIKICDLDITDCCTQTEFATIDCTPDTCQITDLVVTAEGCTAQDSFMAVIDFSYTDECDDQFILNVDGEETTYLYSALPITAGPFAGGCDQDLTIVVTDSLCGACTDTFILSDPCCDTCRIFDLDLVTTPCDSNDQFAVVVDFDHENGSDSFYIQGNGRNLGPLPYSGLPYTLGPLDGDCMTNYEVIIVDADDPGCTASEPIGQVCCGDTCEISNLMVEVLRCDGDSCLVLEVDFEVEDENSSEFDVFDKNGYLASYEYADLPIIIDCFPISGDTFEFIKICDLGDADCCAAVEFPAVDCNELCAIYDVQATPSMCDTNDQFTITLDFQTDNVSDSFLVSGNGRNEGPFGYNQVPLVLGPYDGDCTTDYEFVVSDADDAMCQGISSIGTVCCLDTCEIFNVSLMQTDCDTNDMFRVTLNFEHMNASDSFLVQGNGRNMGPYGYDQIPLDLGLFSGDCMTNYEFIVVDAETPECTSTEVLGTVCCMDTCFITELIVEPSDCDTNDMFFAFIDFETEGTSDSFFVNTSTGSIEGPFAYENVPLVTGPYEADCMREYTFFVIDAEDFNCRSSINVGTVCCEDSCELVDLTAEAIRCNGDSCIQVIFDFDFSEVGTSFNVYDRDSLIGTFEYGTLPSITIDCYPISGESTEYMRVCDVDDPDCCVEIEFDTLDCTIVNVGDLSDQGWDLYYNNQTKNLVIKQTGTSGNPAKLEVVDLNGRLIDRWNVSGDKIIAMSGLQDGVYLVRFESSGKMYHLKFTKL